MTEEKAPPFQNIVIVDVNSEREENVKLMKPEHFVAPSTKEAMQTVLMTDLTTLCEGLVTLAHLIEKEGFHTKEKVLNFTINHLSNEIPNSEVKDVPKEEASEKKKE
jgi:hypothetical protein